MLDSLSLEALGKTPMSESSNRCLLVVVAHPDDETFGCGGLLARYSSEGVRVVLVCATRGEAGEISDPSLATSENLGQVREQELREAARTLGVADLCLLGYRDSGMSGSPSNQHPEALYRADQDQVTGQIVEIIRRVRPQVLVTFDPKGGYGHPDHIAVHKAARDAFVSAGDPSRYLELSANGLQPHSPSRLYYFVFPRSAVYAFQAAIREEGIQSDLADIDPETMGTPDDEITTIIDVAMHKAAKEQAARHHRTQTLGKDPFNWIPEPLRSSFLSTEHLVRAEPPFVSGEPKEKDIFCGI